MENRPDFKTLVTEWLKANRRHLPLNSPAWKLSFFPSSPVTVKQPLLLGKYKSRMSNTDFFYKPISKIGCLNL
jgi:hypothetical protein